jgi:Ca2+/Na+ antiporter
MSFSDRAILWLHIAVVIFTIGPVTAAIMATPRYIRQRNAVMVSYLFRATRIYTIASLLILVFGLILAGMLHDFSKPWLSISMALFIVAVVLLVLIMRDQRRAVTALEAIPAGPDPTTTPVEGGAATAAAAAPALTVAPARVATANSTERIAVAERGRIASMGGITGLIWLVILVLMVWR